MSQNVLNEQKVALESSTSLQDESFEADSRQQAKRRLTRKLDFQLVPVIFLMDLIMLMDRVNIGNARIQGLEKDLNIDPRSNKFNIILSCFWATYIPSGVPSNIILKNVAPSTYLSGITILSGIVCMCQGFTNSFGSLVACRLVLGVFMAGVSPGSALLLSSYYSRWEIQRRYSIIWTSGFLAGAFGGLLAFGFSKLDGLSGQAGWRWIFIIEGLLAVAIGIFAKLALFDWPEQTNRLSAAEKMVLAAKMEETAEKAKMDRLDRQAWLRILKDWKMYIGAALFFSISISTAALSFFMPTILKQYGYTATQSQLHTIPVYVVAAFFTLSVSYLGDRFHRRAIFILMGCGITAVSYTMLLCQENLSLGVKYLAVLIAGAGIFTTAPVTVMWMVTNQSGQYKRAVSLSFLLGWGNIGSIVASNVFLSREVPTFRTGFSVAFAFIGVEAILTMVFMGLLKRENTIRDRGQRDYRWELPSKEVDNLGDDRPDFRFHF